MSTTWKLKYFSVLVLLLFTGVLSILGGTTHPAAALDVDHIESDTVYFKSTRSGEEIPKPLKTSLFDLQYLGPLQGPGQSLPYLLLKGRACQNCIQDTALYAVKPTGGNLSTFVYPGRITDPRTHSVIYDSRTFYGKCLKSSKDADAYVSFQKERVDRRNRLQSSVYIAEPSQQHLDEKLLERHLPALKDTLKRVRAKVCFEVSGHNRSMLTKPFNLKPRQEDEENRDDEDDELESNASGTPGNPTAVPTRE